MRLSTKVRYGVRAIFDIAYNSSGMSVQIKDISKRQQISQRYLEQIFQRLRKGGLVRSKRGPNGGYVLAKPAKEISIGSIIAAVEGNMKLVPCIKKTKKLSKKCNQYDMCVTRSFWDDAADHISEYFNGISIESICEKAKEMGIKREVDYRFMYFI